MFARIDEKIGEQPLLIAVRRGLILIIPLILIGSVALIFLSLPVPGYQRMMEDVFGRGWRNIFLYIHDSTFNILSLLMVLCTAYSYAAENGERYGNTVNPIIVAAVSLCSFIALLGMSNTGFSIANFGVMGVFIAIVAAVTSARLFLQLGSLKFFRIKALTAGANSTFNYAVTSIYPAALTIAAFAVINQVLTVCFGITDIPNFISRYLTDLFDKINSPFGSAILFMLLIHVFWFFGMHGSNILEQVAQNLFAPGSATNHQLIALGQAPTEIFTKHFFDTFVLMGGCGAALCLIGAIFITSRYRNQLRLAQLSLLPVLFNINELVIFGIPIVLNPVFLIPFLTVPLILTVTSYLAMYFGIVPYTSNVVEWTTPVLLSGFAATGSFKGSLLQLFNLILGTLCYIPFVRIAEAVSSVRMKNNLGKVYETFKQSEARGVPSTLLARYDDIGNTARFLASDLEYDLQNNKVMLYYQPQLDYEGNVFGVEALLRWKHDSYGDVYPPLVIALAEETQLIDRLGYWILDKACHDLKAMNQAGLNNITLSVNVSALQLESDLFIGNLEKVLTKYRFEPRFLQIEITEQLALSNSKVLINRIESIKKLGIKLAMDDFGMGHSSLIYLKEYDFDTIKLDGSLVREILSNNNCCNIISSIVFLGKSLNYSVLAEFVDQEEQKSLLHELGCNKYQGYHFSKALPYEELLEYVSVQTVSA
ncbi:MAG TPA: EAL domain-containing protein [Bacillota bacterium]|nr:EAL domain-containing protein [Bacillota bacterium]